MPKSKRWLVVSGLVLILTGFWQVWEGWAGVRIQDLEGYESLGAGAFLLWSGPGSGKASRQPAVNRPRREPRASNAGRTTAIGAEFTLV